MTSESITALVVESDTRRANHIMGLLARSKEPFINAVYAPKLDEALALLERCNCEAVFVSLALPGAASEEVLASIRGFDKVQNVIALLEDENKDALLDAAKRLADDFLFYGDLDTDRLKQTIRMASDRRAMLEDLRRRKVVEEKPGSDYERLLDHFDEAVFMVSVPSGELLFSNQVAKVWFQEDLEAILEDVLEYGVANAESMEMEIETPSPFLPHAQMRSVRMAWGGESRCMISLRDISKRKRAESAYKASQRRLDLALKASNVGTWSWDLVEHQLQYSERWKSQLGYRSDEFPNTLAAFRNALHPDDRDAAVTVLRKVLKGELSEIELRYRMRHKDGSYQRFLCRAEVFPDSSKPSATVLGTHILLGGETASDRESTSSNGMTRLHSNLSERLIARIEKATIKIEKEAARIRSHFRSDSEIADQIGDLEALARKAARLNQTVVRMRSESKSEAAVCCLSDYFERTNRELQSLLPSKVELEFEIQGRLTVPGLDDALFEMAINEAFSTVADHVSSEFKSRLLVRAFAEADDTGTKAITCIEFVYAGSEIPQNELNELRMIPNARAITCEKDGLAILTLTFGHVQSPSTHGKGSDLSQAESDRPLVLLAEDEGVLRGAIRAILSKLGFDVVMAVDGAEAVSLFKERANEFAFALVDLHMPRMDGDSVIATIRSIVPDLPIVRMSGDDKDSVAERHEDGNSIGSFLSKPFGISELKGVLVDLSRQMSVNAEA